MTIEEAIENRERCLSYLKGSIAESQENVEAVKMSIDALRAQKEYEEFKIIWDMYGGEGGIVDLHEEVERLRKGEL